MDINVQSRGGARGMTYFDRPISREIYERANANGGILTREDEKKVLTDAERYGYGASTAGVFEQDGQQYVHCVRFNNCD